MASQEPQRANVLSTGLLSECYRGTYRTDTDSGFEPYAWIQGRGSLIELSIMLTPLLDTARYILVFDTIAKTPLDLPQSKVPYFPAKLVNPGELAQWVPQTEWTPFNLGCLVVSSDAPVWDNQESPPTRDMLSIYARFDYALQYKSKGLR